MKKVNELKVDRSLLVNDFDTYNLSLDKFPISKETISSGVKVKHPNNDQYSFLHHKEFSLHNHLYGDSWNENDVYLISSDGKIKRAIINAQTEKLFGLVDVWEMPVHSSTNSSNFNASITFPSPEMAVVTDGFGFLYIINTLNRAEITQWKAIHTEEELEEKEFKVLSSQVVQEKEHLRSLHCILFLIGSTLPVSSGDDKTSNFKTILKWLHFKEGSEGNWEKIIVNELRSPGSADYVSLEMGCEGLYVISDKEFRTSEEVEETPLKEDLNGTERTYSWQQTSDDVKVWLNIPSDADKSDLKITVKSSSMQVLFKEDIIIEGKFSHPTDADLTTWTLNGSKLEIVLQKVEAGVVWPCLVTDSHQVGNEIINDELVRQIHENLAHLCSENEEQGGTAMLNSGELEECDAFEENRYLWRHNFKTCEVTHKIMLGNDQWLFTLHLVGDQLPAFCMRRDVDGLVWQPVQPAKNNDNFQCTHVHTFPAFGYIAASKQDKKFLVASPSMNYVAIINSIGHVIVFRKKNAPDDSVLRNRRTCVTTKCFYLQNLVNLESNSQTVGAVAFNKYLFVLTTSDIIMVNIDVI